jgi:hypothetical protein
MAFVPEGQADSSQARSASGIDLKRLRPGGTVDAIFLVIPGTSCLSTIVLSLRDKTNRHRVPRTIFELLGWILLSLRDEEPSQNILIFVPFIPGVIPIARRNFPEVRPGNRSSWRR